MNSSQHIFFMWDKGPVNYIDVLLRSLRLYNKDCVVHFHYRDESLVDRYKKHNVNFVKIDPKSFNNKRQFYKVSKAKELCEVLSEGSQVLILDCDLLFQNDPFLMFSKHPDNDLYYTHCIMSKRDSLRPESIWKSVEYKVNGGVWGFNVNSNVKKLFSFWIDNLIKPSWSAWINHPPRKEHGLNNLDWWIDQDFLNCLDINDTPFPLKKVDAGYEFNYYTSTWGFFNDQISMISKIGNKNFPIIHFKADFRKAFNLENSSVYNIENILSKNDLVSNASRDMMMNKFLSRGEKRFHVV